MCCPVVALVSTVRTPPVWTCPPPETMRPVRVDVHVQCLAVGPAGTSYSDDRQLFSGSHSGVTARTPGVESGSQFTLNVNQTRLVASEWFMMWNTPVTGSEPRW